MALASVLDRAGDLTVATTVALPVVRGPVVLARTAGALNLLSGGRLVLGVAPGSSARPLKFKGTIDETTLAFLNVSATVAFTLRHCSSLQFNSLIACLSPPKLGVNTSKQHLSRCT